MSQFHLIIIYAWAQRSYEEATETEACGSNSVNRKFGGSSTYKSKAFFLKTATMEYNEAYSSKQRLTFSYNIMTVFSCLLCNEIE